MGLGEAGNRRESPILANIYCSKVTNIKAIRVHTQIAFVFIYVYCCKKSKCV